MRHHANTFLLITGIVVASAGVIASQWLVPNFMDVFEISVQNCRYSHVCSCTAVVSFGSHR